MRAKPRGRSPLVYPDPKQLQAVCGPRDPGDRGEQFLVEHRGGQLRIDDEATVLPAYRDQLAFAVVVESYFKHLRGRPRVVDRI